MRNVVLSLLMILWVLVTSGWAVAEEGVRDGTQEKLSGDPLGRSTPRGTVEGFLKATEVADDARAAKYLDLRNLPKEIAQYSPEQLARGLAIVLQRAVWIDLERLSSDPEGEAGDGLPSYRDQVVQVETSAKPIPILLQRVPAEDGGRIWKFSNATLANLNILYDEYRYTPYVEWLARELPETSLLGVDLFKWVTVLCVVLIAAPLVLLLAWLLSRLLVSPERPLHASVRRFMLGPVAVFVLVLVANQTLLTLGMGLVAQEITRGYTVITAATVWLLWQLINLWRDIYSSRLKADGRMGTLALLRPLTSASKTLLLLLGLLIWVDNLGFEITAVLTGLGIGGIAVALVLQKPLEDVFGAITLYTQQPIRIGDFGRFGQFTGTVEEISLRTTRIRTLDNSLVAVPNMRLAGEAIENLSAREKFLFQPQLRLRNDTPAAALQQVLTAIRALLEGHEKVHEGARVRFTSLGTVSHDLSVFAYIDAPDWAGYLEVAEVLNFGLLDILDDAGVSLAVPFSDVLEAGRR